MNRRKQAEDWYNRQLNGERLTDIAKQENVSLGTISGALNAHKKHFKAYKIRQELFDK